VIVPTNVKELYSISPEDQRPLTVIKDIGVIGNIDMSPFLSFKVNTT
jgi:hypothetical protein